MNLLSQLLLMPRRQEARVEVGEEYSGDKKFAAMLALETRCIFDSLFEIFENELFFLCLLGAVL